MGESAPWLKDKLHHGMLKGSYAGTYMTIRYIVGMRNTSYIDLRRASLYSNSSDSGISCLAKWTFENLLVTMVQESKHILGDKIMK
jgi:hypothetical protein